MPNKKLIPIFVFIITISFYINTLLPSLAWGDGVKLQSEAIAGESFVLAEMSPEEFSPDPFLFSRVGVAAWDHPLYIVMGNVLVRAFPWVDSLWLVNLISAFFGAGSVALVFLLCYRFTGGLFSSLYAALSLAVSHTFWWHSSTPEVYTLLICLLLLSFYFFDHFESTDKTAFLVSSAFFLGLAASAHIMAFLALPALGIYFVSRAFGNSKRSFFLCHSEPRSGEARPEPGRRESPSFMETYLKKEILRSLRSLRMTSTWRKLFYNFYLKKTAMALFGFLIGFSLYIIQFIRMSKNFPLDEIKGPVLGSTFLSQLGTFSPILLGESLLSYLFFLTVQFGPVGLILGGLGLLKAFEGENRSLRKLVAFFIVFALFGIFYRVTDQFTFFIPSYVFWAMMMGLGADYVFGMLRGKWRFLLPAFLGILLLGTPFFYTALPGLAERNGINDASIGIPKIGTGVRDGLAYYMNPYKRGDTGAYDFGIRTISNLAPRAVVIAEWYTDTDEYFILRYFTEIELVRPDVTVVGWPTQDPFSFDSRLALDLIEESLPGHPVYLASLSEKFYAASTLVKNYCITSENNLYRLYQKENKNLPCLGKEAVTE